MIGDLPGLAFLTLSYAHHHGGMTDWITHMAISSVVHAVIYGFVFRLMHHLTLQQDAVLVAGVLALAFVWARSRDIERFYNPRRRHSPIGYLSPIEFEKIKALA